jgi:fermentation-respiration switch protein FrsA (DUF1100 family)
VTVEIVAEASERGIQAETWRFAGSRGDEILADAYLAPEPGPVILIGHGKGNSRKAQYVRGPGALWARTGLSVVAADAPLHGDRAGSAPVPEVTAADPDLVRWWLADSLALIGAVEERMGEVPLGYVGFSMGGVFGTRLLAEDRRVRAGVLVVAGAPAVSVAERFPDRADLEPALTETDPCAVAGEIAPRPVLMLNADDDEVFSRRSVLALYDALRPPKELVFLPGTHSEWRRPARWFHHMREFLRESLRVEP